jgi:antitoxin MazE
MNVGKWGNSLAIRLPKDVVEALGLKEGDEIKLTAKTLRHLEIERDNARDNALTKLRGLKQPLPDGYSFNRDDAHGR